MQGTEREIEGEREGARNRKSMSKIHGAGERERIRDLECVREEIEGGRGNERETYRVCERGDRGSERENVHET